MGRRYRDYKPIEFRQLCAIVRMLLQQEPTIDDAEWKARTKDHLQTLGFDEPPAETLSRAMTQVEYALKQTIGERRQIPAPAPPKAPQPPPAESSIRTNRPQGWDIVLSLMAKLRHGSGSSPSSPMPTEPRELLSLTEEEIADGFWREVRVGADRLTLLRSFAEVAIVRPPGWDYLGIRAEAHIHKLKAQGCFVCGRNDGIDWHHVVQVQHGGSNYVRNRVPLCGACHRAVHPWMGDEPRRTVTGWTNTADLTAEAAEKIRAMHDRERA